MEQEIKNAIKTAYEDILASATSELEDDCRHAGMSSTTIEVKEHWNMDVFNLWLKRYNTAVKKIVREINNEIYWSVKYNKEDGELEVEWELPIHNPFSDIECELDELSFDKEE